MKRIIGRILFVVMVMMAGWVQSEIPSSERSRAIVTKQEGLLKEALAKEGLKMGAPVFMRIFKEQSMLEVWMKKDETFQLFRSYKICKFSGKLGPKLKEGDKQAPEGCYPVGPDQMNPNSDYHVSFNLGYPNAFDLEHSRTGSWLMVHGGCASVGCYAMGDDAIEEIWTLCFRALENGQKAFDVHCFPFPLTKANLKEHGRNEWIGFWKELKPIYEQFEKTHIPPNVVVSKGKYKITRK